MPSDQDFPIENPSSIDPWSARLVALARQGPFTHDQLVAGLLGSLDLIGDMLMGIAIDHGGAVRVELGTKDFMSARHPFKVTVGPVEDGQIWGIGQGTSLSVAVDEAMKSFNREKAGEF